MVREVREVTSRDDFEYPTFDHEGELFVEPQERPATPLTKEALVESFQIWVSKNPQESFENVLKDWIGARLDLGLAVNPDGSSETHPQQPTHAFRSALKFAFDSVRANTKRKKK